MVKKNARAGIGVYFGKGDIRNVSRRIEGKQTNNRAELLAIIKALEILEKEAEKGTRINIYTDSKYSILCCTTYGRRMEGQGWINKGKPILMWILSKRHTDYSKSTIMCALFMS